MQFGLFKSDLITQPDINNISKIFDNTIKEFNPKTNIALDILTESSIENDLQTQNYSLILCFNDADVLDLFRIQRSTEIPVLCVEIPGDHSFFSSITLRELSWGFLQIFETNFEYDPRIRMQIDDNYIALNDVLITPKAPGQRMRYDVLLNQKSLLQSPDSANQILISTPTGSTALNLNLGGSIALPSSNIFQILSVASRNRGITSHIIPDTSIIEVEIIESEYPVVFNYDNQRFIPITQKEGKANIKIQKADKKAIFIKFPELNDTMHAQHKLYEKQSFEDTRTLTSSAKFILHVLKSTNGNLSTNELIKHTNITNRKTLSNALNLLLQKGFIRKHLDLQDARKYTYSFIKE